MKLAKEIKVHNFIFFENIIGGNTLFWTCLSEATLVDSST